MRSRSRSLAIALLFACCFQVKWLSGQWALTNPYRNSRLESLLTLREDLKHVDVAVACCLLGFITYVMGHFYLLNHHDSVIRRNAWEVLSTTLAIFTSVCLFQGLDGIFETFVLSHVAHRLQEDMVIVVSTSHFLVWFLLMQCAIGNIALGLETQQESDDEMDEMKAKELEAGKLEWEERMKSWSIVLSHMTAFAAIATVREIQKMDRFHQSAFASFFPMFGFAIMLFLMFRLSCNIRNRIYPDGEEYLEAVEAWDDEAAESENEVASISISYVLVRWLFFLVCGEPEIFEAANDGVLLSCVLLVVLSLLFLLVLVVCVRYLQAESVEDEIPTFHSQLGLGTYNTYVKRWCYICLDASGMAFAWCILHVLMLLVEYGARHFDIPLARTETIGGLLLACSASFTAYSIIFCIEWVIDLRSDAALKQGRTIIRSLGILIGFAWETCFDEGTEAVAQLVESDNGSMHVALAKFALAVIVSVVVMPAWRHHILPIVLAYHHH